MKEMVYGKNIKEILDIGTYKGKDYVIVNLGIHPCAYVQSDKNCCGTFEEPAHCGFTFYNTLSHWEKHADNEKQKIILRKKFVGWDYGHYGDYSPYWQEGKKWTTEEILENVKEVIEWLLKKEGE